MNDLRIIIKIKNNLIWKRAELIWGNIKTQAELSKLLEIRQDKIGLILNFKYNPVDRNGNWKILSMKLSEKLKCFPEDIFPKYFEKVIKNKYQIECDSKVWFDLIEYKQKTPEEKYIIEENKNFLQETLTKLNPREEKIIKMRFFEEKTLREIASEFNVSPDRIRQIEARAIRKLRHPLYTRNIDRRLIQ